MASEGSAHRIQGFPVLGENVVGCQAEGLQESGKCLVGWSENSTNEVRIRKFLRQTKHLYTKQRENKCT